MKHWTKEEETFLKKNYKTMYFCDIARRLNKSLMAVKRKANRMRFIADRMGQPKILKIYVGAVGKDNPNWKGGISKKKYNYTKKYCAKYPEKRRAQVIVYNATKSGKLIRPQKCSKCDFEGKIEAHHTDYSKPLKIDWLCKKCHIFEHQKLLV